MRIFAVSAALIVGLIACSGPSKKKTEIGATEGSDQAGETCCCKSNPIAANDGQPIYEVGNRMECSSKQGECVPDVQCAQAAQPE
ncbi:MAG: hypothetical protein H0T46_35190 [Deltaproteobacteria bacterium]|nr:hypothetical protein [Deltaproteobacteria bacterium]